MVSPNRIAEIAAVIGEPARAAMLTVLMNGRALTASELAAVAGITPQTASTHLARLVAVELITVETQGRHRYHRLSSPSVARMLEDLMQHASASDWTRRAPRTGPRDEALRRARTCYDHLAGRLGVAIADAVVAGGHVEIDDGAGLITERGRQFFTSVGIALPDPERHGRLVSRPLCRLCLDWSERRPHLAGRLGAALCRHSFEAGWVRRINGTRAVSVTPKGRSQMSKLLGLELGATA
ncbi:MAG TPA: winged helix-turn-helix domain-containing protein [Hyphomicrobiaceae bacterium]|nr:winged helix-turn-helix domain-containing protein [Hyphomicrobiaceae bacterium]